MPESIHLDLTYLPQTLATRVATLRSLGAGIVTQMKQDQHPGGHWTGWFDFPRRQGHELVGQIRSYQDRIKFEYDLVVVVGIGGSYLGTRAVADALGEPIENALLPNRLGGKNKRLPIVYLGQHLSESSTAETLEIIQHRKPLVNVISKSGTTTEPSVAFRIIREALEKRFGTHEANQRIIATTDPKAGALLELAKAHQYKTFVVPEDMGGRYSVLSAVGLLPLALAQYDIDRLMQGASTLFEEVIQHPGEHPATGYAAARSALYESGKKIEILSFNQPKLHFLGEWWKQLFGESEGKDHKGLFPASLTFTTDLHSLGQYAQQGERHLIETFLNFRTDSSTQSLRVPASDQSQDGLAYLQGTAIEVINDAAMQATLLAHSDGGVDCMSLNLGLLDAFNLGYLLAFFETSCALSGTMIGVNPFDQPGVEDYKRNLFALLGKPGYEELHDQLRPRQSARDPNKR